MSGQADNGISTKRSPSPNGVDQPSNKKTKQSTDGKVQQIQHTRNNILDKAKVRATLDNYNVRNQEALKAHSTCDGATHFNTYKDMVPSWSKLGDAEKKAVDKVWKSSGAQGEVSIPKLLESDELLRRAAEGRGVTVRDLRKALEAYQAKL